MLLKTPSSSQLCKQTHRSLLTHPKLETLSSHALLWAWGENSGRHSEKRVIYFCRKTSCSGSGLRQRARSKAIGKVLQAFWKICPGIRKGRGGGCGGRRSRTEGGESPSTPHRDNAGFKASFLTPKRVTFKVPSGGLSEKEGEETGC